MHCLGLLGKTHEELRLRREIYANDLARLGPADETVILSGTNLTRVLMKTDLFAEAIQFSRENLAAGRRALGDSNGECMRAACRLAEALFHNAEASLADILESEALFAEAVMKGRHIFGPEHPLQIEMVAGLAKVRNFLARARVPP